MTEIIIYFARLGLLGFGGPVALLAQMQRELVLEKSWLTEDEYNKAFGLIKSLPGPSAFMMASYIGFRKKGFLGALSAGVFLILPAFLMMVLLASQRNQLRDFSLFGKAIHGLEVAALALIVSALAPLTKGYRREWFFWVLGALSASIAFETSIPEYFLVPVFGLMSLIYFNRKKIFSNSLKTSFSLVLFEPNVMMQLKDLFLVCFKAGALVFGTGIVIVSFLQRDFVEVHHWLTAAEFKEAITFGQLSPGPFLITVTYAGFLMTGITGAIVGTVAVFLPGFIHMVTWFPRGLDWLSKQAWWGQMVFGIIGAVVGYLLVTVYKLSIGYSLLDFFFLSIYLYLLIWRKWSSMKVLGLGLVLGLMI